MASARSIFSPSNSRTFFSSTRLTPEAMTSTVRPLADLKTSDLAISATVQPMAAAASCEVRVLASNSTTSKAGPRTACTLSALGAVAGFI
jgi:hypothetical protein